MMKIQISHAWLLLDTRWKYQDNSAPCTAMLFSSILCTLIYLPHPRDSIVSARVPLSTKNLPK